jgi:putative sterol carrier protein
VSGGVDTWRGIFDGKVNPTVALATGKMKLKGNKTRLLKNMAAFTYVIDTMKRLDYV